MRKRERIEIESPFIKLDSFLKLANAVQSGGEAKIAIIEGEVSVNGEICTQRGRKLRPGDIISFGEMEFEVADVP